MSIEGNCPFVSIGETWKEICGDNVIFSSRTLAEKRRNDTFSILSNKPLKANYFHSWLVFVRVEMKYKTILVF